jgi:hypothetical protein
MLDMFDQTQAGQGRVSSSALSFIRAISEINIGERRNGYWKFLSLARERREKMEKRVLRGGWITSKWKVPGNSYVLRSLVFLFVRLTPDLDWAVGLDL